MILPEYLVEFEYSTTKSESETEFDSKAVSNKELNKIFSATIESQRLLQNTYLNPQSKDGSKGTSFHISSEDLDRSDMACIKILLRKYLTLCHVQELIDNNFKFPDEDNTSSKAAIENNLPPEIPNRSKCDSMSLDVITTATRESKLDFIKYLNLFNNNIKVIENTPNLINLTTLILSFNEIKIIQGLDNLVHLK